MKNLFLIFFLLLFGNVYSQTYEDTICWVWVNDTKYEAKQGVDFSDRSDLNAILNSNQVHYYEKALPFAHNPELLKIHEIRCAGNIENLIHELTFNLGDKMGQFSRFEICEEGRWVYDPEDYMWQLTLLEPDLWLWHLLKTQCNLAWDITKGDPDVKIAIIDYDFDIEHPDLASEITPPYDPYTNDIFECIPPLPPNSPWFHGTVVASFASAETTEQGGTSQGQLASAGFNTKIIGYITSSSRQTNLAKALHASNIMGADVIVSCGGMGSLSCFPDPSSGEELIVKEILDNGTVIVMPAGNGPTGTSCGPPGNQHAFYPFNPEYDDRIIIVTGTDKYDYHYFENSQGQEKTHSHFPEVDICAPGHELMGAVITECGGNTWPYYGSHGGTSYASPITAGICGLLKSVNNDFTPGEIQEFIKITADPVMDEQNYPGLIGAGRINAYQAVNLAANCTAEVITGTQTWNEDRIILCGLIIETDAVLTVTSKVKFSKRSNIIINLGGKLILDNCILTSLDNVPWQGIEVWGNPYATQIPANQGILQVINGGTIENAEVAVRVGSEDYTGKGGGIVYATDANFKNNDVSVWFDPYSYSPSNASYFRYCTFDYDRTITGEADFTFAKLNCVDYVNFEDCDFTNNSSQNHVGIGIESVNSTPVVEGKCTTYQGNDCTAWEYGLFSNLYYAIYATASNATDFADVRHTTFTNNFRGIYLSGMTLPRVTSNEFYCEQNKSTDIINKYHG